jgi:antitoxin ParD1/3/4
MRTNIEIDDDIMQAALRGGAFKTKREAVEAGLKLLAQQAHYREVLKWEGKLHWDDQPSSNPANENMVMESVTPYGISSKAQAALRKHQKLASNLSSNLAKKKAAA